MQIQDELNLHGKVLVEALKETNVFIEKSFNSGLLKIKIITGKGIHSPKGEAVLRPNIIKALRSSDKIREIIENPKAEDGGSGAIIVILKNKMH